MKSTMYCAKGFKSNLSVDVIVIVMVMVKRHVSLVRQGLFCTLVGKYSTLYKVLGTFEEKKVPRFTRLIDVVKKSKNLHHHQETFFLGSRV